MQRNKFVRNIAYAFGAQGISMILSVLMTLFLPKVLGVESFGYWQLFIFYISYTGFFHLGLNDGVYLKQGGKDYAELNYQLLNSNLILITVFQCFLAVFTIFSVLFIGTLNPDRIYIIVCTMIYMVLYNYSGFLSYILQVSNRIRAYSVSVVIEKIIFLIAVVAGILTDARSFKIYIILNLIAKLISVVYSVRCCRELVFSRPNFDREAFGDLLDNIKVGINITISSVAGMLILGIGRTLIDARWGVSAFSKFSLAISLSNFILQFVAQASTVLFPALKRVSRDKISAYFFTIQKFLSVVLLGVLIGYFPLSILLKFWLPQYAVSLKYMVVLLPICVFDGKMNLLSNTYLKVLRKERQLLYLNIIAMVLSGLLCLFSAYVINSVVAVSVSMVVAIAVRCVGSELYLTRLLGGKISADLLNDSVVCIVFVAATWWGGMIVGLLLYLCAYVILCWSYRHQILNVIKTFLAH